MPEKKPTQADLIHDRDADVLALLVEFQHGRRNVACGDDMLFQPDGGLDDIDVEGVGDQADDQVMLRELGVQGLVVGNIERDGVCVLDTSRERLGGLEGPASCSRDVSGPTAGFDSARETIPTVTETPDSERMSRVGLVTKPAPSINTLQSYVSVLAFYVPRCWGWPCLTYGMPL